jgi:DNA primase
LQHHLLERQFTEQEMVEAGMLSEREGGGRYDRFRNRIMIPIRDAQARMAGFGARIVDPQDVPKFLNSPQTTLFDKGRLLFGLDKARKAIRVADQAVIVEGYLDVMGLHQAGFQNVVSPMGTALSEAQLRILKKHTRRILLALDADAAGDKATLRGLDVARQAMDREFDPVFDARGLVRHEGRLDAELRVVTLPAGRDPDEVVAESPGAWPELVSRSRTVVDYVMDVLTEGRDLGDAKVKAAVAQQVLPLIADVADPVEREAYRQSLARRLRVDERALAGLKMPPPERTTASRTRAKDERPDAGEVGVERFCLGWILREPELLYRMDRQMQELGLERLAPGDFTGTDQQVIFQAVREALAQDGVDPGAFWRSHLPESIRAEAETILGDLARIGQVVELDLQQRRVAEEVTARFLQLRKRNLEQSLSQMQFQLQAVQEEAAAGVPERQDDVREMAREVQRLATFKSSVEQALARRQGLGGRPLSSAKW